MSYSSGSRRTGWPWRPSWTRSGPPKNPAKLAAAWLAENVGRLKLNGQFLQYSDLSRLLELEGLGLGIHGKMDLWRGLIAVRDAYPPLNGGSVTA